MLKLIKFAPDHLDLINHKIKYANLDQVKKETESFEELGDKAVTCMFEDRVLFSCGLKMVNPRVAHLWCVPSKYCDKHPKKTFKTVKELMEVNVKERKIQRVQTSVAEIFDSWITHLGFHHESTMIKANEDGSDIRLFVKLF